MPITSILASAVFQQGEEGGLLAFLTGTTGLLLCISALMIIAIIGTWRTFEKAGQPGWGAIIPIYNAYLLLKIAGRPGWWLILLLIPLVNVVIWLLVSIWYRPILRQERGLGRHPDLPAQRLGPADLGLQ